MRNLFGPLWPFVNLLRVAGLPPAQVLLPGLIALSAFMALSASHPDLDENVRFVAGFLAGAVVLCYQNLPAAVARIGSFNLETVSARGLTAIVFVLFGILVWTWSPIWCQRSVTFVALLRVTLFASDFLETDFPATRMLFPDAAYDPARADLARVLAVAGLSIALLNETLIQHVSLAVWLVWWAVLPVVLHQLREGLVLAVMIAHDPKR